MVSADPASAVLDGAVALAARSSDSAVAGMFSALSSATVRTSSDTVSPSLLVHKEGLGDQMGRTSFKLDISDMQ